MAAVEGDEDDISLTSTAESVFQDEYEVETIHAQDIINGQKVYLVKWKGYEDLRCTWEPRHSFNTKEVLREWNDKKRQVERGTRQPFDVEAWRAECEAFENAREDRKRRRREKRARLGLSESENQETTAVPTATPTATVTTTELEMIAPLSAASDTSSDGETPLIQRRSLGQDGPSNINHVQTESSTQHRTISINIQPKPLTAQSTIIRPANQTARQTERPKVVPPKPVDIKVVDRIERKDLANVMNRARQQPHPPPEKSKTWKLLQTTHRFEKASRKDHEPNRGDLELQSPKTWSPFQMSSFLRRRQETETDNSLFVEQDEVPETQQTFLPQTPAASIDSHVLPSQRSAAAEHPSALPPSTIPPSDPQEIRESPAMESSKYYAPKHYSPPLSKKWWANSGGRKIGGRQLRKKEDILCQISYGTGADAVEIGDALLCDLTKYPREMVYKLRYGVEIRVRFEELCTLDRFQSLSREIRNRANFNGFILGFEDTQPELSDLEKLLLDKDLVAIARICPRPAESDRGLTLVCYPTLSKSFQFLNKNNYESPEDSLRFAGFNEVFPRHPRNVAPARDELRSSLHRPEREGRYEDSGKSKEEGMTAWRFPSKTTTFARQPDDSSLGVKERLEIHDPRLEVSAIRKDQAPTASQFAHSTVVSKTAITGQEESSTAFPDAMDTSSDSSPEPAEDAMVISTSQAHVSNEIGVPSPGPLTPSEQYSNQVIPETQDVQMLDISNPENVKQFLENIFLNTYKITYDDLAAITSHSTVKLANCFYLWFPEDADADFQVLERFLDQHFAIVLSNRKQNDWEKFTKSSSGVALFHHSFLQYSEMPGFHNLTMSSSFNFWNVSLPTPIPNIEPQTHFQRLFPQGTGYLMTEDFMLHERDAAIMILAWFRDTAVAKFPGTLKLMLRPNVLKWLDRMSKEDPRFAVMAVLIGDTACQGGSSNWPVEARDLDCFYNPSLESPVISLAELPNTESAVDSSNPDAEGTEQTKDTDLLCEVFAAWAVLNAASLRKFHILTHNIPMDRWQRWQHIEIIQGGNDFFRKSNINKDHYTKWIAQGASDSSAPPAPSSGISAKLPSKPPPSPWTAAAAAAPRPPNERAVTWNSEAHRLPTSNRPPPGTGPDRRLSR